MILIAHRGNFNGRNIQLENNPDYIEDAILNGFNVELDIWIKHKAIYLGHDGPQYKINESFLKKYKKRLWCHAKNYCALSYLSNKKLHCFFHDKDEYTLTSNKIIWAYSGKIVSNKYPSVAVMPEYSPNYIVPDDIYAVCSDNLLSFLN